MSFDMNCLLIVFAFERICCWYALKSSSIASLKQTALAAITCINGPPCDPGNNAELSFFCNSSLGPARINPPLGPTKVL